LNTRQDEFKAMKAGRLKDAASKLDDLLTNCAFQTIVHGDAKVANFCFSNDVKSAAMVDFQYTGRGCGMKDVVYLLGSCLDAEGCDLFEEELLNFYFSELQKSIAQCNSSVQFEALEFEWRRMYSIAWTDFTRFLQGWMPTHKKLNAYSQKLLDQALSSIV
jgi:aminoglycoside phosphotransferase (APT) family kinase protein